MYHGTAVADLDKDGKPELVIGSYNDTLYCINGENGTTKWKYAASGGYIGAPASIGDIDKDGNCEVVFVSGYKVYALSNTGTLKWQYNIPGYSGAFRGCALADINNDAFLDVIFGTDNGNVIALMGNNGTLIWSYDLAAHYGNSDFGIDHAPLISDFDNNDTLDVFIVGGYSEYPAIQNNFGRAYMLTAGKGNGPDWLMFQHDIRRQSSLCEDATNTVNENPDQKNEIKVFPNPANDKIEVTGLINGTIEIINVQGQIVKTLNASSTKTTIDLTKLSGGVYLIKVKTDKGIAVKKLIKQ
jgi:hypothetical protein